MAQTPAQDQYDADLKQLNNTPKSSIGEAAWNQLKKAFDLKYPDGRPKDTEDLGTKNNDGAAQALAFGLTDSLIKAFPELQKVYDLFILKDYTEARLQYFATNYYKNITETIVVDKCRSWTLPPNIELLKKYVGDDFKIIIC